MANKFWEHIADAGFYLKSLANMGDAANGAVVQFGKTGRGIAANYMVTLRDGTALVFSGRTHGPYGGKVKRFADKNLSEPYTHAEIQGFVCRSMEKLAEA